MTPRLNNCPATGGTCNTPTVCAYNCTKMPMPIQMLGDEPDWRNEPEPAPKWMVIAVVLTACAAVVAWAVTL